MPDRILHNWSRNLRLTNTRTHTHGTGREQGGKYSSQPFPVFGSNARSKDDAPLVH